MEGEGAIPLSIPASLAQSLLHMQDPDVVFMREVLAGDSDDSDEEERDHHAELRALVEEMETLGESLRKGSKV